jgi:hypothetical protein
MTKLTRSVGHRLELDELAANRVPPQNLVDGAIVDVSMLGVKLAYPDD